MLRSDGVVWGSDEECLGVMRNWGDCGGECDIPNYS